MRFFISLVLLNVHGLNAAALPLADFDDKLKIKIGKHEFMKCESVIQTSLSLTATDSENINSILRAFEKLKSFPGGNITISIDDLEKHIQEPKNKETLRSLLSDSLKGFPENFRFLFDREALEGDVAIPNQYEDTYFSGLPHSARKDDGSSSSLGPKGCGDPVILMHCEHTEKKFMPSSVSPHYSSQGQHLEDEEKATKPETLITKTWSTVSYLWELYPLLCLMAGVGLLSMVNTFLSGCFYSKRRLTLARIFLNKSLSPS